MSKKKDSVTEAREAEIKRTKLPRKGQLIGVLDRRLGGSRAYVKCMDGKTRICRIPGKLKRRLWAREGDIILIEPWEFDKERKGDIIFKYTFNQVKNLRRKGYLKSIDEFEDF